MSKQITITGITTTAGAATEVTITGHLPIKSIISGRLFVSHIAAATLPALAATVLTVVTTTPAATGQIQRTANDKFKLWIDTVGVAPSDILALIVDVRGEQVRP